MQSFGGEVAEFPLRQNFASCSVGDIEVRLELVPRSNSTQPFTPTMTAGSSKKSGAKGPKPTQAKTEARTLKRKRDQEDVEKLRKATDDLVSRSLHPSFAPHLS